MDWGSFQNIYAVEMDSVKGITFFFSSDELFRIHVHHSEESCAMDTFVHFHNRRRLTLTWIYLPISQHDRVLVLGIQATVQFRFVSLLVRTELIGDVIIGEQSEGELDDRHWAAFAPLTMLYGEPVEGRPVRFVGGHCRVPRDGALPKLFPLKGPGPCPIDDSCTFFSWAPLSAVASTLVFYDQNTGFCRGTLFQYQNGGSRAVGQCRLHVDPAESVVQPGQLCFRVNSSLSFRNRTIPTVEVKFRQAARTNPTKKDMDGWESRPMKGLVKFWFTTEASFLVVEDLDKASL